MITLSVEKCVIIFRMHFTIIIINLHSARFLHKCTKKPKLYEQTLNYPDFFCDFFVIIFDENKKSFR